MGDIRGGIHPGVVKIIGLGVTRDGRRIGFCRGFGNRGAEVLRDDSKEGGAEGDAKNDDNSDKNGVRSFFFHIIIL